MFHNLVDITQNLRSISMIQKHFNQTRNDFKPQAGILWYVDQEKWTKGSNGQGHTWTCERRTWLVRRGRSRTAKRDVRAAGEDRGA